MSKLFETTEINGMKLRNRFVRSATWEGMASPEGRMIDHPFGNTAEGYIWPARHPVPNLTGTNRSLDAPPMGARFRLKWSYVIPDSASAEVKVILQAMKEYGIVLADQGSEWYITGCPDERWNNEPLHWLDENLQGSAFEAVDTSSLMISEDSAACRQ